MSQPSADWTSQFAVALRNAASDAVATKAGHQELSMSEFAPMIRQAKRDITRRRSLSQYQIRFGESIEDATRLLRSHPCMSNLIGKRSSAVAEYSLSGLHTLSHFAGPERFLRSLVEMALRFSAICGEVAGAKRTDEALRLGTGRGLPGHEVTFFSGLVLEDPWRVVPGLSLMPYKIFRQQLDEMARWTYDSCLGTALWQDEFGKKPSIAVLIRQFKWGPAFSLNEAAFPTDHDYEYADRLLESASLVELLSLVAGLPLQIVAHHSRAEQWFYDLLGDGFDLGCHYFRRSPVDLDPGNGKAIVAGKRRPFEQAVERWAKFAEEDRKRARLVMSRLSGALSRKGSLALEDRILDVAISLEILYAMTRRDKLANWAAVLLEDNKTNRDEIRLKVEALHDCRTAIVHDLSELEGAEDTSDVYTGGFEIARSSLLMHLNRGAFLSRIDRKLLDRGIRPPIDAMGHERKATATGD